MQCRPSCSGQRLHILEALGFRLVVVIKSKIKNLLLSISREAVNIQLFAQINKQYADGNVDRGIKCNAINEIMDE